MRKIMSAIVILLFTGVLPAAQQQSMSEEGGRVLALEKAWNLALEEKNTKALDMLLANTMVSVDIDGNISSRGEFLASIKSIRTIELFAAIESVMHGWSALHSK